MTLAQIVKATRKSVALFDMTSRGRLEVRGSERVRWLDGMISGDVKALVQGPEGSGCYATLLTNRGAIVADLHVGKLGDVFTLESLASEISRIRAALERFIIADDVELVDVGASELVLGLEGPGSAAILATVLGAAVPKPNDWLTGKIAGKSVLIAAFGFSGEAAFQIRLAPADRVEVEAALDAALGEGAIARGDADALEVLRIEAGIPALGRELDEDVLPPEARLEHAISTSKGCYVGQEIVARLRSRGQVNHLLVGLRIEAADGSFFSAEGSLPSAEGPPLFAEGSLPSLGTVLAVGGKTTGEITSVAMSPAVGAIALAYVRREHAEVGTRVDYATGSGVVAALPFVALNAEMN